MDNENPKKSKINIILKIAIPVLIVCIIAGIWVVKDMQKGTSSKDGDNQDFTLNVTESLNLEQLKSYGLPIIIEFGSDSCIPCKQMAPIIESLNEELRGKAIIRFVDVWKYPDLANGIPLSVIPTQVFFDSNGKPYNPADPNALSMNLYTTKDSSEHVFTTHEGTITKDELLTILKEMGMKS